MQKPTEWSEFQDTIVPSLTKFYTRKFAHPVFISETDKREMLSFLQQGPEAASLPEWVDWNHGSSVRPHQPQQPTTTTLSAPEPTRRKKLFRPFLQPRHNSNGKKCKCACAQKVRPEKGVTHPPQMGEDESGGWVFARVQNRNSMLAPSRVKGVEKMLHQGACWARKESRTNTYRQSTRL